MQTQIFSIRKMHAGDLEPALEILRMWNMAPVAPSRDVPDPERTSIQIENSFIAMKDGHVVGIASYILHGAGMAETASLAVDPTCKGLGIGYALQMARLQEMKHRGVKRVITESDRPETIQWYIRKFGYKVTGRNKKKHPFGKIDEPHWTVLELELSDA